MIPINYKRIMAMVNLMSDEIARIEGKRNRLPVITASLGEDQDFYQEDKVKMDKEVKFFQDFIDDIEKELEMLNFTLSISGGEKNTDKKDIFGATNVFNK